MHSLRARNVQDDQGKLAHLFAHSGKSAGLGLSRASESVLPFRLTGLRSHSNTRQTALSASGLRGLPGLTASLGCGSRSPYG
jgi:hypothetical protein